MKYHVTIEEDKGGWTRHHTVEASSRRDAISLVVSLKGQGVKAGLLWTPDSAADIRRETARGRNWAKRMWHFGRVADSADLGRATRAWSRLVLQRS